MFSFFADGVEKKKVALASNDGDSCAGVRGKHTLKHMQMTLRHTGQMQAYGPDTFFFFLTPVSLNSPASAKLSLHSD